MKKTALIILDGWGKGPDGASNAILNARTPVMDRLLKEHPNSELLTHGEHVGLPEGQMGNSEVGHLNIGAGRVVYQDLVRINKAISSGELKRNPVLLEALNYAQDHNKQVHFLGLVSTGGVHSHQDHLTALCKIADDAGLQNVFIHAITDGRDRDPHSGKQHLMDLEASISGSSARIASVIGRYYAMDRDKRWERIRKAYDLYTAGIGEAVSSSAEAIEKSYAAGISDEFLEPFVIQNNEGESLAKIEVGDAVICFNFRTDRCRQITTALTQTELPDFGMKPMELHYVTMTRYDESFNGVRVLFEKENLTDTLGEVVSKAEGSQLRIAETEKYPHVTFFFSGGREEPFDGEGRIVVPSPKVATYDLQPQMSADEVTREAITYIEGESPDLVCLNFANPDMVGHTGVYDAIVTAVETVDTCLGKILECCGYNGYSALIIADHGNADYTMNEDGTPNTAHTINPVPCVLIDDRYDTIADGVLADVAPTILTLMGLAQPEKMMGKSLIG